MPKANRYFLKGHVLAYHAPVPQKGVPTQVRQGPGRVGAVAIRGQEAIRSERPETSIQGAFDRYAWVIEDVRINHCGRDVRMA